MKEQRCKIDSQTLFLERLGQNPGSYNPHALLRRQIIGTEHGDMFSITTLEKRTEGSSDRTPDCVGQKSRFR